METADVMVSVGETGEHCSLSTFFPDTPHILAFGGDSLTLLDSDGVRVLAHVVCPDEIVMAAECTFDGELGPCIFVLLANDAYVWSVPREEGFFVHTPTRLSSVIALHAGVLLEAVDTMGLSADSFSIRSSHAGSGLGSGLGLMGDMTRSSFGDGSVVGSGRGDDSEVFRFFYLHHPLEPMRRVAVAPNSVTADALLEERGVVCVQCDADRRLVWFCQVGSGVMVACRYCFVEAEQGKAEQGKADNGKGEQGKDEHGGDSEPANDGRSRASRVDPDW